MNLRPACPPPCCLDGVGARCGVISAVRRSWSFRTGDMVSLQPHQLRGKGLPPLPRPTRHLRVLPDGVCQPQDRGVSRWDLGKELKGTVPWGPGAGAWEGGGQSLRVETSWHWGRKRGQPEAGGEAQAAGFLLVSRWQEQVPGPSEASAGFRRLQERGGQCPSTAVPSPLWVRLWAPHARSSLWATRAHTPRPPCPRISCSLPLCGTASHPFGW